MNAEKFLHNWISLLDLTSISSQPNIDVTLMYIPKRLPRKIKKRYKNNNVNIVLK